MFEVRNYSTSDIELDGKKVPHGASILFETIENTSLMSSLISKGKISVVLTNTSEPISKKNTNLSVKEVAVDVESTVKEDVNIVTTTSKKRKTKDNDSEVENSKSTKGDMNNATD